MSQQSKVEDFYDHKALKLVEPSRKEFGGSGGPPDNSQMEARLSALEEAVKNLPTKADLAELRLSSQADASTLRADFEKSRADATKANGDLRGEFERMRGDVSKGFSDLRADMHKNTVDIQRWMIVTVISLFLGFSGLFFTMSNATKQPTAPLPTQQAPIIINVPAASPATAPAK